MGEGPIPWSAIDHWCVSLGLDDEERDDVHYLVRQLDNAFLKQKAEAKKN